MTTTATRSPWILSSQPHLANTLEVALITDGVFGELEHEHGVFISEFESSSCPLDVKPLRRTVDKAKLIRGELRSLIFRIGGSLADTSVVWDAEASEETDGER